MTPAKLFMHAYGWGSLVIVIAGVAWVFVFPPTSLRTDRDGVAHFTPDVEHPITGDAVSVNTLIKHYRGD
ncbi:hypothetical protein [Marimonas lutisalis]|uniref:hypothetical protein n=1 Tax=Marimonas lutisalis TaxID=2545756 RepID=UPI0010F996A3|nr:hypothetical protein [Marimonas lutisalis]